MLTLTVVFFHSFLEESLLSVFLDNVSLWVLLG